MDLYKMSDEKTAGILYNITNSVIVQTPGRSFPGVVIQGDQLRRALRIVENIRNHCPQEGREELHDGVEDLYDFLHEKVFIYQSVLEDLGLQLPFTDRVSPPSAPDVSVPDSPPIS